jgi:hypothetical protein
LWEGYDEWAHFGFVERIVTSGHPLVDRSAPVSLEVQASMKLAPAPWNTGKPFTPEDEYWRLPAAERAGRMQKLRDIPINWSRQPEPAGSPIYEALQPPLYYWILAIPYRLLSARPLLDRVFLLRYLSVLICSLAIPVVFRVARRVSGSVRTALFAVTLVLALPELMIDVGRVGNECLGILVFSWLILLALPPDEQLSLRPAMWTGAALGFGLITKAYFLTAIPALAILYAFRLWQSAHRRAWVVRGAFLFGVSFLIAGWWYVRNRITTGSWAGLLETVKLVHYSLPQFWAGALHLSWRNALDSILLSHVWFGGWSSLGVRSWMYHLMFLIAAIGAAGVIVAFFRKVDRRRFIAPLVTIYAFFWLGQLYNVLLIFLTKGVATSMGWYMYCVVAAEATLLVIGLQTIAPARWRAWVLAALVVMVAALDLYTVHFVSIPYYVGLIAHRVNDGALQAFHLSQLKGIGIAEILERLSEFKPFWLTPQSLVFTWAAYIVATLFLICFACWLALPGRAARWETPVNPPAASPLTDSDFRPAAVLPAEPPLRD